MPTLTSRSFGVPLIAHYKCSSAYSTALQSYAALQNGDLAQIQLDRASRLQHANCWYHTLQSSRRG